MLERKMKCNIQQEKQIIFGNEKKLSVNESIYFMDVFITYAGTERNLLKLLKLTFKICIFFHFGNI